MFIDHQRIGLFPHVLKLKLDINFLLICHVFDLFNTITDHLLKVKVLVIEDKLSILQLGQVQEIVDESLDHFGRKH